MRPTLFLVLSMLPLLSGCAEPIRNTYNAVTVATGCHLLRDAETRDCHRRTQEEARGSPEPPPTADAAPKP